MQRTKFGDVEVATCTDIKQSWGKIKSKTSNMYDVGPVEQFCHGVPYNAVSRFSTLDKAGVANGFNILLKSKHKMLDYIYSKTTL